MLRNVDQTVIDLSTGEIVLRVVLASVLGGLIGFEREISDQPAGFRTHILVSLGAMLFTVAGADVVDGLDAGRRGIDPTRVAAQVVTGIGFLGAGAIIQQGASVRGLTTAAALWVTAAIGLAIGLGHYQAAVASALATLVTLYGLKRLERVVLARFRRGETQDPG